MPGPIGLSPRMLQAIIASGLISPPALWGKLPAHADFVRSGMRHGESEGWQPWLAENASAAESDSAAVLPAAFVLTPGTLSFAPRHFVLGVIRPSADSMGRRHAFLVYQKAHPRWVRRHFAVQANQPLDWLFWLARVVARHTGAGEKGELQPLRRSIHALWRLHAPNWRELVGRRARREAVEAAGAQAAAVIERWAEPAPGHDPVQDLRGVRFLRWADWPGRLQNEAGSHAFWQQDGSGGFVNAADRLPDLWRVDWTDLWSTR